MDALGSSNGNVRAKWMENGESEPLPARHEVEEEEEEEAANEGKGVQVVRRREN